MPKLRNTKAENIERADAFGKGTITHLNHGHL